MYSTNIELDNALRFALKNAVSLNIKPKTQALICFEGCSSAGQHVLAVLPTGYMGKFGQIYEQLLPNMSEIGMFQSISVLRWKSRVYHNCCLAVIGPGTPDFEFEQE